jgi:hypothetical protein
MRATQLGPARHVQVREIKSEICEISLGFIWVARIRGP